MALRSRLTEEVGDTYERAKIQAAGPVSSLLDKLICRWHEIQTQKEDSK